MTNLTPQEFVECITNLSDFTEALNTCGNFKEFAICVDDATIYLTKCYMQGKMSHARFHFMNQGYNYIFDYGRMAFKRFDKESKEWFEKYGQ